MAVSSARLPITLEWISEDGSGQNGDQEVRTRIRKQAMKLAGMARKQRGDWGKRNRVSSVSSDSTPSDRSGDVSPVRSGSGSPPRSGNISPVRSGKTSPVRSGNVSPIHGADVFPIRSGDFSPDCTDMTVANLTRALPPAINMTQLMQFYGINIVNFWSMMNQIHVGRVAKNSLNTRPENTVALLRTQDAAPAFELPRFDSTTITSGEMECLSDALECLSIRAHELVNPSCRVSPEKTIHTYGKALKSLQKAVYDPASCSSANVLCAVEALSLFEIMDRSQDTHHQDAWTEHIAGASRLIEMRGPENFQTDFEQHLLFSAASSIVCECLRTNRSCFLEEPKWQEFFRSAIVPDELFSPRSELFITLWNLYLRMPGMFRMVSNVVCHQDTMSAKKIERVSWAAQEYRNEIASWRTEFQSKLIQSVLSRRDEPPAVVLETRSALQGSSLALSIISNRLFGALNTATASMLEDEVQMYAHELEKLCTGLSLTNPWVGFFLAQKKITTAESVMKTSTNWRSAARDNRGIIEKRMFEEWCRAMPRQTCCDSAVWAAVEDEDEE